MRGKSGWGHQAELDDWPAQLAYLITMQKLGLLRRVRSVQARV